MNIEAMQEDAFKTIDGMSQEESKLALKAMYRLCTTTNPGHAEEFIDHPAIASLVVTTMLAMVFRVMQNQDDKIKSLEHDKDPLNMKNLSRDLGT